MTFGGYTPIPVTLRTEHLTSCCVTRVLNDHRPGEARLGIERESHEFSMHEK